MVPEVGGGFGQVHGLDGEAGGDALVQGGEGTHPQLPAQRGLADQQPRGPGPGQQVGVMLGHGGDDDDVAGQPQAVREVVECLSGVPADDGNVIAAA